MQTPWHELTVLKSRASSYLMQTRKICPTNQCCDSFITCTSHRSTFPLHRKCVFRGNSVFTAQNGWSGLHNENSTECYQHHAAAQGMSNKREKCWDNLQGAFGPIFQTFSQDWDTSCVHGLWSWQMHQCLLHLLSGSGALLLDHNSSNPLLSTRWDSREDDIVICTACVCVHIHI